MGVIFSCFILQIVDIKNLSIKKCLRNKKGAPNFNFEYDPGGFMMDQVVQSISQIWKG
jgi:hypothetical protein